MARTENVIRGFEFLLKQSISQKWFTVSECVTATGWSSSSITTYISKQWKDYLSVRGTGKAKQFQVRREFQRVNLEEFLRFATQKRLVVPRYQRAKHEVVIQFEFLLPLSKEEQLKRALDELFYADTLKARIHEIGLDRLETIIKRANGSDDDRYIAKVLDVVTGYFGGYSIFHVQGRFRASMLTDMAGAAADMAKRKRYLIDETTAVVRFIAPCTSSRQEFADDFDSIVQALAEHEELETTAVTEEITLIRCLFFFFFVEAVVLTVKGEDEIWLLETGPRRKLYKWMKENA